MTYRVRLASRAEKDIDGILTYLVRRSPQGAATWFDQWKEVLQELAWDAHRRSLAPENDDHEEVLYHIVFKTKRGKAYRAVFVIEDDTVLVTHVRGPGQDTIPPHELP